MPVTGHNWLRVLGGDAPRLVPIFGGGSPTVRPFEVNIADWPCFGGGMTPFELLVSPGLKRELLLLCLDLDERLGSEE